jgi:hypothetical protein
MLVEKNIEYQIALFAVRKLKVTGQCLYVF